jgi:hypothetical protein
MHSQEQDHDIRRSEDCTTKAAYCAWAAQNTADPEMRQYLEGLARQWAVSAAVQVLHSEPASQ